MKAKLSRNCLIKYLLKQMSWKKHNSFSITTWSNDSVKQYRLNLMMSNHILMILLWPSVKLIVYYTSKNWKYEFLNICKLQKMFKNACSSMNNWLENGPVRFFINKTQSLLVSLIGQWVEQQLLFVTWTKLHFSKTT